MQTQFIYLEGHFGSQDPALQLTPEVTAALSQHFQQERERRAAEATAKQAAPEAASQPRQKQAV